jgi:hypothetical protein
LILSAYLTRGATHPFFIPSSIYLMRYLYFAYYLYLYLQMILLQLYLY